MAKGDVFNYLFVIAVLSLSLLNQGWGVPKHYLVETQDGDNNVVGTQDDDAYVVGPQDGDNNVVGSQDDDAYVVGTQENLARTHGFRSASKSCCYSLFLGARGKSFCINNFYENYCEWNCLDMACAPVDTQKGRCERGKTANVVPVPSSDMPNAEEFKFSCGDWPTSDVFKKVDKDDDECLTVEEYIAFDPKGEGEARFNVWNTVKKYGLSEWGKVDNCVDKWEYSRSHKFP